MHDPYIKISDEPKLVLTVVKNNNERRKTFPTEHFHWLKETGDIVHDHELGELKILDVAHSIKLDKTSKYALKESEESEERCRCLFELSQDPMWLIVDNQLLIANDAAVRTLGYSSAYELKNNYPSLLSPEYQSDGQSSFAKANVMMSMAYQYGYHRFEWLHKKLNGEVFPVEVSLTRIPYKGLYALYCVWNDISEKKIEQDRMIQKNKLLDILHNSTSHFVKTGLFRDTQKMLLDSVLELTESEYGFTVDVVNDDNEMPNILANREIDGIGINSLTFYKGGDNNLVENNSFNSFIEDIINSGNSYICNIPTPSLHAVQLPLGYSLISSILAFPIFFGESIVGIYGICNRKNGYDNNIISFLHDVGPSLGVMFNSKRLMDEDLYNKERLLDTVKHVEQVNQAKSIFITNMSHELRTPLNAVLGFSQLINADKDLSIDNKKDISEVINAGEYLLDLINKVLELSKIEAGKSVLVLETININKIIEECLNLIKLSARERGITINYNELVGAKAVADRIHLKQVLLNLLTNAIKYNNEQGLLSISVEKLNEAMLKIKIVDTGNGLTEHQITKIFEPFERLTAENSTIEGTGIGLTICKNIIEAMNGKIGVSSTVGKGSCFWINIPLV